MSTGGGVILPVIYYFTVIEWNYDSLRESLREHYFAQTGFFFKS